MVHRGLVVEDPVDAVAGVVADHRAALALEVRGHAEQRADGHHAGAANTRDQHAEGLTERRQLRCAEFCCT